MHFRFYELIDLVNKKDSRLELIFEDQGYVDDIDLFLTGCMSYLPIIFYIDGTSTTKKLLNCPKKFKTMLDFYNEKIKCQGQLITELQGYERARLRNAEIITYNILPGAEHRDKIIQYFKL